MLFRSKMNWQMFQTQAEALVRVSADCAEFQWRWVSSGVALEGQACIDFRTTRAVEDCAYLLTASVVWSPAYCVPVLYFRASDLSGAPVSLQQLKDDVLAQDAAEMDCTLRWGLIAAAEHPVSGEPFFFLHPCETATLLGPQLSLVRWMSVALQLLRIRFPLRLVSALAV